MALYNILLYKNCCRVGNIEIINILEMKQLENTQRNEATRKYPVDRYNERC
jgi:hypothetical protein